jgi:demethylmenaquinone methyltransferase / 2-methoxy-6-polyprenyl-1,4-benzoquinol methylase
MSEFAHDKVVPYQGSAQGKKDQVAEMFDDIAPRYDFMNRFLSAGIDVSWRKKALSELKSIKPQIMLDVATGTADVAIMAARILKPAKIIGIDISTGMLDLGRKKLLKEGLDGQIELQTGDSEAINFPDASFDAVTVAFGVRNFAHLEKGLSEINRVLKPGGKLVVLEFSKPKIIGIQQFYNLYMGIVAPGMGSIFSKNRDAYQYLHDSVQKFPEGKAFTDILNQTGFKENTCKRLSLGICSIYTGIK